MELPIFNDNLKSSASWADRLKSAQQVWKGDAAQTRELQVRQTLPQTGAIKNEQDIDESRLRDADDLISTWACQPAGQLNSERLIELHRALTGETNGPLRTNEPTPINEAHDPTPAALLPQMLANAFDWFSTQSFNELHPVEQASVVFLRLLDLYPFTSHNEITALLAASFYTERVGLPPLIIFGDETTQARYGQALEAALRMLTQPLVEFFAEMLMRTMQSEAGPRVENPEP